MLTSMFIWFSPIRGMVYTQTTWVTVVYSSVGQCEGLNKGYTNLVTHVFFIV